GYKLTEGGQESEGQLIECGQMYHPVDFAGFDVVSVLSLDLAGGLDVGAGTGVLAAGQTVYASADRFYVATNNWIAPTVAGDTAIEPAPADFTTQIHAFDNTGDTASYVASGEVDGMLLNQFSMDESDGYLRVITTEGSPWGAQESSETFLTVLDEVDRDLVTVGRVGGLGKGESLYSARLMDDIGFAVTFRQIDPFYVLDLSDPKAPKVAGELKLPGFSTYLHPIGEDLVLGVGKDATEEGAVTGFKVSLFSVADPTKPVELDSWVTDNADSAAEYDHRAFQYLPDRNLVVLPLRSWSGEFNGAVLLEVGETSLTEVGRITHVRPDEGPKTDCTQLTEDDLTSETSELYWMVREAAAVVQVCEPGDDPGYGGFYCDPVPLAEVKNWGLSTDELEGLEDRFALESTVELCWPGDDNWRLQIQRSIIIGDELWTMSWDRLQANDLGTFEATGAVDLQG
ncbi:MAG: beta-propeller domain-containing protein, partial [Acidimicrobiia bacterium]|nr:beta-propeller domain-containing protein [Acidimicrobiia bacterium]